MAGFLEKLTALSDSQHSVENTSEWVLAHEDQRDELVRVWTTYVASAECPPKKKLSMLYLGNDLVQKSRKKAGSQMADAVKRMLFDSMIELGSTNPQV